MLISEAFLLCLSLVESGNRDIPGDGGAAQGPLQIHVITVEEANDIIYHQNKELGRSFYTYEDRHDYWMARSIAFVVLEHWKPIMEKRYKMRWTEADALALWRWGPDQWTPKSKENKVDKQRYRDYCRYYEGLKK